MNSHGKTCDAFVAGFVIERYAAGTLPEHESRPFEEHLLTCDRCQEELQLAIVVREALREADVRAAPAGSGSDEDPVRRIDLAPDEPPRLPWRGIGAVTLAAAAVAVLLLIPRDHVSAEFAELGRVTQPPVYLGVPVRQAPARPDSVFGAAMMAYVAGDYEGTVTGLDAALAAGFEPAPAEFFRGASLLMLDRTDEAITAFDAVVAQGESPYLPEAHYYRAKALLTVGRPDDALVALHASTAVAPAGAEIAASARALADSIEVLMGG